MGPFLMNGGYWRMTTEGGSQNRRERFWTHEVRPKGECQGWRESTPPIITKSPGVILDARTAPEGRVPGMARVDSTHYFFAAEAAPTNLPGSLFQTKHEHRATSGSYNPLLTVYCK